MAQPVYLVQFDSITIPEEQNRIPRDRYRDYVNDLYKIYPGEVNESTFFEGSQATYAELGDALFLQEGINKRLTEVDTTIVAHWSHEFDPEYASCGPYFLDKYKMKSDIFDVCDQGILAPFTALKLLELYLQAESQSLGMLLCLEQTTIPRDKTAGDIIPVESGALSVLVSKAAQAGSLKLLATGIIPETSVLTELANLEGLICKEVGSLLRNNTALRVLLRKGSTAFKAINWNILSGKSHFSAKQLSFIQPKPGCLSALQALAEVSKSEEQAEQFLIIDEDVESLSVAYLLVEKVNEAI